MTSSTSTSSGTGDGSTIKSVTGYQYLEHVQREGLLA